MNLSKWITTVAIILANIILWLIPSNVYYLIAQQRDVLLGRYSLEHVSFGLFLFIASLMALYINWSNKQNSAGRLTAEKKRWFQVVSLTFAIVFAILVVDIFVRLLGTKQYVGDSSLYHRTPNTTSHSIIKDTPETSFAYPTTAPGYHDIEYTLTVDKRGFRNKTNLEKYDIVVLGDSFAEGSHVSDEDAWPVLLAQKTNNTVYNLAMSGGHPLSYLEILKTFGLELNPKIVFCLLYEGNDFRDSNFRTKTGLSAALNSYIKTSPIRRACQNLLVQYLAPINSGRLKKMVANPAGLNTKQTPAVAGAQNSPLSFLPVAIPDGNNARYYTFKVKKLLAHFETEDKFLRSFGCKKTFESLSEMKKLCDQKNIRFIVAYAPDEPHIFLPLIKHKITPQQLHAFMSVNAKKLPDPEDLMDITLSRLNIQESETEKFCRQRSIEFVSLTEPLRQSISAGRQAYFTYDQHWTPIGHQIVADVLADYLKIDPSISQPLITEQ